MLNQGTGTLTDVDINANASTGYAIPGVGGGGIYNAPSATLSVRGGMIEGNTTARDGGGLNNRGTAALSGVTISGNSAEKISASGAFGDGGGVFNDGGTITLTGCTISGNTALLFGRGVDNAAGTASLSGSTLAGDIGNTGTLTVDYSLISDNSVIFFDDAYGGGVVNYGNASISNSTISDNSASSYGGGLLNDGSATLTACTLSGNTANEYGGAISNSGHASIYGCRLVDNTAGSYGGGISVYSGSLTIERSSVTGNTAGRQGAGLFVYGGPAYQGSLTMGGVTVSGNSAPQGGGIFNSGTVTAAGITLSGNSAATGGGIDNAAGATATISGQRRHDHVDRRPHRRQHGRGRRRRPVRQRDGGAGKLPCVGQLGSIRRRDLRSAGQHGDAHWLAGDLQQEGQHCRDGHLRLRPAPTADIGIRRGRRRWTGRRPRLGGACVGGC